MFRSKGLHFGVLLLFLSHESFSSILKRSRDGNYVTVGVARRGKSPETSSDTDASSSNEKHKSGGTSLELKSLSSSSGSKKGDHRGFAPVNPKLRGWRRWHRDCAPCPEDMALKWRDPRIGWICGAYQRARRSFKSECSMHMRNCQDGTMFTKIHDYKCAKDSNRTDTNGTTLFPRHGKVFFYDYRVHLSGDHSSLYTDSISSTSDSSSSSENLYQ